MKQRDESYVFLVVAAAVLALAVVSAALWYLKGSPLPVETAKGTPQQPSEKETKGKKDKGEKKAVSDARHWTNADGRESSGAAFVPGTNQVLFVDDRDSANILCVTLDDDANQSGDLIQVPLGTNVDDAEDITFDGTYFYVTGSQFRRKSDRAASIVRFKYDAENHSVSELQAVVGLPALLEKNVPELADSTGQVRTENAINIEGLGWDPNGKRLLLGFRNPLVDKQALVVPVSMTDPNGAFAADNLTFAPAMKLDLQGNAIRSIEFDSAKGKFLIVSGATEGEKKDAFYLWSWDGAGAPQQVVELDKKIKPEGITTVDRDGDHFLYLVGDAGYYQRLADPLP